MTTLESEELPVSKLPKAQQELVWALASSVVGLTSCLGEAQEDIIEAISQRAAIIRLLFALLNHEAVPEELFNESLSCLTVLTEDNETLTKQIADHDVWFKRLMQLRELGGSKAVGVCGVLHNIFYALQWFDHNTPIEGASDAVLIPTLMDCVRQYQGKLGHPNGSTTSGADHVLQLALEITASIATSLQEALEHANGNEKDFEGFSDDKTDVDDVMMEGDGSNGDEESDDQNDNDDDDDEMNDEMEADMAKVAGFDDKDDESTDSLTLDALVKKATPILLTLAKPSEDEAAKTAIREGALSALNNVAWTVSSLDFASGSPNITQLWSTLAQRIWAEAITPVLVSNTADIALASSVTSLAWAVSRSMQGQVKLQADEHRKFMALYQASKGLEAPNGSGDSDDAFQGLGVKSIGVLGQLALSPAPLDLNREIGVFLLTVLAGLPATPAADAVEALNQIFDIYADKEYECDRIYWDNGFQKHLGELQPLAKKMAKAIDKRKMGELRERADEAVLNLDRFLRYKKNERKAS